MFPDNKSFAHIHVSSARYLCLWPVSKQIERGDGGRRFSDLQGGIVARERNWMSSATRCEERRSDLLRVSLSDEVLEDLDNLKVYVGKSFLEISSELKCRYMKLQNKYKIEKKEDCDNGRMK